MDVGEEAVSGAIPPVTSSAGADTRSDGAVRSDGATCGPIPPRVSSAGFATRLLAEGVLIACETSAAGPERSADTPAFAPAVTALRPSEVASFVNMVESGDAAAAPVPVP
jgi:hypothetical protein